VAWCLWPNCKGQTVQSINREACVRSRSQRWRRRGGNKAKYRARNEDSCEGNFKKGEIGNRIRSKSQGWAMMCESGRTLAQVRFWTQNWWHHFHCLDQVEDRFNAEQRTRVSADRQKPTMRSIWWRKQAEPNNVKIKAEEPFHPIHWQVHPIHWQVSCHKFVATAVSGTTVCLKNKRLTMTMRKGDGNIGTSVMQGHGD